MWTFESVDGDRGEGDDPVEAVLDCLGEDAEIDTEEVTTDEQEIVVRDDNGNVLGWARSTEDG
jgi:hypothetical protein